MRRSVCRALGSFRRDTTAATLLLQASRSDKSEYVRAAALHALARTGDKRAMAALKQGVRTPSHNDIIASSCLSAFGQLRDLAALPLLQRYSEYGRPQYLRFSATLALGRLWEFCDKKQQADVRDTFQKLLRDPLHAERRAALMALRDVPDPELMSRLEDVGRNDPIGLLRRIARETIRHLRETMGEQQKVAALRKEMEELRSENKRVQAQVGEVQALLKSQGRNGAGKRARSALGAGPTGPRGATGRGRRAQAS